MCGGCNGDTNGAPAVAASNGTSTTTTNTTHPAQGRPQNSPYQSMQDYLSNVGNFKIIESEYHFLTNYMW